MALKVAVPFSNASRAVIAIWILLRLQSAEGRAGENLSLEGWHPGFFSGEEFRQLLAPLDAELGVGTGEVALDGFESDVELVGDFPVGATLCRQLCDT
jgi:hypothetical protein